jgi:2-hydroxy-6-oxonona-2,4-dienedioate hydrolase
MHIFRKTIYAITVIILTGVLLIAILPFMLPIGAQQADTDLPFSNSRFTNVDSILLHYRIFEPAGDSVKGNVAMIHGFCGSTFSWRNNAGALAAAGYRVVCVDLPGFGYSSRRQGISHSPAQNARLVWHILDSVAPGKWHIFGHSMGASVAAYMATMHPGQTKSLWMVDGISYNRLQKKHFNLAAFILSSAPIKRWAEVLGRYYFFKPDKIKELLQSAYGQAPDTLAVQGYLKPLLLPATASAIMDIGDQAGPDAPLLLKELPVPVYFIWGANDNWLPLNKFKSAIDALPAAKLLQVKGAGHCPMETHSPIVNSFVLSNLDSLP